MRWARVTDRLSPLPDDEARFAELAPPRTQPFLLGRRLLREMTGAHEVTAHCADCSGPHGRPMIAGWFSSVTHAAGVTVVAASRSGALGVDAEPVRAGEDRIAAIRELTTDAPDEASAVLRHWTRVEAVLKADGRGLRVDPREVVVDGMFAVLETRRYALLAHEVPGLVVTTAQRTA